MEPGPIGMGPRPDVHPDGDQRAGVHHHKAAACLLGNRRSCLPGICRLAIREEHALVCRGRAGPCAAVPRGCGPSRWGAHEGHDCAPAAAVPPVVRGRCVPGVVRSDAAGGDDASQGQRTDDGGAETVVPSCRCPLHSGPWAFGEPARFLRLGRTVPVGIAGLPAIDRWPPRHVLLPRCDLRELESLQRRVGGFAGSSSVRCGHRASPA